MAFFDDPGRELRRLEEELLAEEEEAYEEEYDEYEEFDDLDDYDEDIPIVRNHANGYGTRPVNYAVDFDRTVYDDEEMDDDAAFYKDDYKAARKTRKKEKKKKKGSGCLVLVILLELIGIGAVIGWWINWLK